MAAAAVVFCVAAAPAYAQSLNTQQNGTYGSVNLRAGFTPDPHSIELTAGGTTDVSQVQSACIGFVARRADYTLRYRKGEETLFISATSDADTTLVVRAPNGSYSCDDDSGGGLNPVVRFDAPASGRYQIWVGTFGGANAPATLHISENGVPIVGETPEFALDPAYGVVDLVSGFQPDPHTINVEAGGSIDASAIPGCAGWIARAPDYRVNWTAGSGALPLVFSVQAEADTTLVINDANSNWVCDDDGGNNGLNPAITFANPASGQYDVWVGTFAPGSLQPSVLNVSELYAQ